MKIVFVSNTFHHHQANVSENLYEVTGGNYAFIETEPMNSERINLGWGNFCLPEYVRQAWKGKKEKDECVALINGAEYVIFGAASKEFIAERLKAGKLVFVYSEHLFKQEANRVVRFAKGVKYWLIAGRYKNAYLLCASGYAARDYNSLGLYRGKTYKYGYFPEYQHKSYQQLLEIKKKNPMIHIVWVGRLIDWKHPEKAILCAEMLRSNGIAFHMDMIGNGALQERIENSLHEKQLEDFITLHGSMPTNKVHEYMERADIHLFTSDHGEGWGAVLNESMDSACAVVADNRIGSVPHLIKHEQNGLVYENDGKLFEYLKCLAESSQLRERLGKAAYSTIHDEWNAKMVANRFIPFAQEIEQKGYCDLYAEGVLSKTQI